MKTLIPKFPGFYYSGLADVIDCEMEHEAEYLAENGATHEEAAAQVEKRFDYRAAMLGVSQGWLEYWRDETGIAAKFIEIDSPRKYNFTTDSVIADVPKEELKAILWKIVCGDWLCAFQDVLEESFTARSGFIPYYSNQFEDWDLNEIDRPLDDWNEVEISMLLATSIAARDIEIESSPDEPCVYESAQSGWLN